MPSALKPAQPLGAHRSAHARVWVSICAVFLSLIGAGCRPPQREYELRGVVVAVRAEQLEITIKHEDIPRFMPGMTMPFKVRDGKLLQGRVPGDVVRATLVVEDADAYLRTLERTGSAPVPLDPALSLAGMVRPGEQVPETAFTDQAGTRRRISDWRGQALAVTFIYTRCPIPNFCPRMDQHFRAVQDIVVADASLRGRVHLLSVSFDPDYDRPPVLASHAKQLGARADTWTFLTGDRQDIDAFAARFGISVFREQGSPQELVHNLRTAVIDPAGRLVTILRDSEWTPQTLAAEMRNALGR